MVLTGCLTFSPAKWALPQLNGPVQVCNLSVNRQLTDRAILANRQTQEKKKTATVRLPPGPERESDVVYRLMQRRGHTGRKALAKTKNRGRNSNLNGTDQSEIIHLKGRRQTSNSKILTGNGLQA